MVSKEILESLLPLECDRYAYGRLYPTPEHPESHCSAIVMTTLGKIVNLWAPVPLGDNPLVSAQEYLARIDYPLVDLVDQGNGTLTKVLYPGVTMYVFVCGYS